MDPKLLIAPLVLLTLAACDQSPEAPATPTESTIEQNVEQNLERADDNISDALSNLQDAGDSLSEAARSALTAAEGSLAEARVALQAMSQDVQEAVGDEVSALVVNLEERRDAAMSEAQKAETVAETRTRAEALARAAGLSADQITQAGDAAENAARRVLGYEGP